MGFRSRDVYGSAICFKLCSACVPRAAAHGIGSRRMKASKKNLIEETYEVIEAINQQDKALLCEELGDVLMQVVFHARWRRRRFLHL